MPTIITKNQQNPDRKSSEVITKYVESSVSNIERKTRDMERILNKFPVSARHREK